MTYNITFNQPFFLFIPNANKRLSEITPQDFLAGYDIAGQFLLPKTFFTRLLSIHTLLIFLLPVILCNFFSATSNHQRSDLIPFLCHCCSSEEVIQFYSNSPMFIWGPDLSTKLQIQKSNPPREFSTWISKRDLEVDFSKTRVLIPPFRNLLHPQPFLSQ